MFYLVHLYLLWPIHSYCPSVLVLRICLCAENIKSTYVILFNKPNFYYWEHLSKGPLTFDDKSCELKNFNEKQNVLIRTSHVACHSVLIRTSHENKLFSSKHLMRAKVFSSFQNISWKHRTKTLYACTIVSWKSLLILVGRGSTLEKKSCKHLREINGFVRVLVRCTAGLYFFF